MRVFAKFGLQRFPRLAWKRNFISVWLSYDFIALEKNFDGILLFFYLTRLLVSGR